MENGYYRLYALCPVRIRKVERSQSSIPVYGQDNKTVLLTVAWTAAFGSFGFCDAACDNVVYIPIK
jgi:hypothetical protein